MSQNLRTVTWSIRGRSIFSPWEYATGLHKSERVPFLFPVQGRWSLRTPIQTRFFLYSVLHSLSDPHRCCRQNIRSRDHDTFHQSYDRELRLSQSTRSHSSNLEGRPDNRRTRSWLALRREPIGRCHKEARLA